MKFINIKEGKKNISAVIDLIKPDTSSGTLERLTSYIIYLKQNNEYREYFLSLERKYKNDVFKKELLSSNWGAYNGSRQPDDVSFSGDIKRYDVDNNSLLYEFSNIADHFYDKPI